MNKPCLKDPATGRFVKGTGGGNPFNAKIHNFRKEFLENVKPEHIKDVYDTVYKMAKSGNLQAAKMFLQYVIGLPKKLEDGDINQQQANHLREVGTGQLIDLLKEVRKKKD